LRIFFDQEKNGNKQFETTFQIIEKISIEKHFFAARISYRIGKSIYLEKQFVWKSYFISSKFIEEEF
jgi:hypothetical protein